MKASAINPSAELKALLGNNIKIGTGASAQTVTVYCEGSRPTNDVPTDFIEIGMNGTPESMTDKLGLIRGYVAVTLYCKLFDDGTVRTNRVSNLLSQIEDRINRKASTNYFFWYDPTNFIMPTMADLDGGYSISTFNVQWRTK